MIGDQRLVTWNAFCDQRVRAAWKREGFSEDEAAQAQAAGVMSPSVAMQYKRLGLTEWTARAVAAIQALNPWFDPSNAPPIVDFEPVAEEDLQMALDGLKAIQAKLLEIGDTDGSNRMLDDIAAVTAALASVQKGVELRGLVTRERGWLFVEVRSPAAS